MNFLILLEFRVREREHRKRRKQPAAVSEAIFALPMHGVAKMPQDEIQFFHLIYGE
jgi:hypothetical protein